MRTTMPGVLDILTLLHAQPHQIMRYHARNQNLFHLSAQVVNRLLRENRKSIPIFLLKTF